MATRHYDARADAEIRARNERVRRERGHDAPMVCLACGMRLADVCEWHPWEMCEAYRTLPVGSRRMPV